MEKSQLQKEFDELLPWDRREFIMDITANYYGRDVIRQVRERYGEE